MESLARTLFLTSVSSFLVFLISDFLRPGFVSNYFSVHWVLLLAIVSGLWWSTIATNGRERHATSVAFALLFGAVLATVAWRIGEGLGEYIFLVAAIAFFTPLLILQLVRSSTSL